jgi:hypothetical protein
LHAQAQRWDISQILTELERLRTAESDPTLVDSAELFAEELAIRTTSSVKYIWDLDALNARLSLPSGVTVVISPDNTDGKVIIDARWAKSDHHEHKKITKWLKPAVDRGRSSLDKTGWRVTGSTSNSNNICLSAEQTVSSLRSRLNQAAIGVTNTIKHLSFD